MEIGSVIHHFRVCAVRELPELEAKLWEMEHVKNGAKLVWLDRKDENKTFSIAFKTIPEDSTGVFHILEHSVLCGSDKYPVKEPFVELLKSSVQTFLNAMTYPDKTVYPVSTRNDRDLLNLMDVYLDAVLHPAIYHKPEIFRQEGWRYELRDGEPPIYQGVVFNEMKGAYGSPQSVLLHAVTKLAFPDNCYSAESGGHPEHIPDLTYEQFIANHQKYYHPSNSRICLVGSVDLDPVLEKIDSYLNEYDRLDVCFDIPMQTPVEAVETEIPYEIGKEEAPEGKTILCSASLIGTFADKEKIIAASVLADYLAGDNEAPLKRAILDRQLGQDVQINVLDGIQQPGISWEIWNTDREKLPEIRRVLAEVFTSLAENGLDRDRLEACFNNYAFQLRDRDGSGYPRSLGEALVMLDTWLYDGDPAEALLVEDALNSLAAKLNTGWFEQLLRELFLDSAHTVTVVMTPSQTLGEAKREKEAARLAAESAEWTEEKIAELKEQSAVLTAWQQTPDSPEALATIPMLRLDELAEAPAPLPTEVGELGGLTLLRHKSGSSLCYLSLHFAASDLTAEELPCAALLCSALTMLPTSQYSSAELQVLLKQKIGKLGVSTGILTGSDPAHCKLDLSVSMACLESQKDAAAELLTEILTATKYEDRKVLRDLLNQAALDGQMSISAAGNRYALYRTSAYTTAHGLARELTGGVSYVNFLKQMSTASDAELDALLAKLKAVAERVFTRSRLTVGASEKLDDATILRVADALACGKPSAAEAAFTPLGVRQEGLLIPAAIGFAGKACNLKQHGRAYCGSIPVLANILNYMYLWSEIRVQGGAYGCGFIGRDDGDLVFTTYRDPQPGRSVGVFDRAGAFIRDFCAGDPDLTGPILASVSEIDPLLNTENKMAVAELRYFKGVSYERICQRYSELIHTTKDDLLALSEALDELAAGKQICLVAGQAQLDAAADLNLDVHSAT